MSCGVSEGVILCNESMRGCVMSCRVVCYVVPSIARAEVPNRDGLGLGLELSQCHRVYRVVCQRV